MWGGWARAGSCAGGSVLGPGMAGGCLCPVLAGPCGAIAPGACWCPLSPPQLPIVASSVVTLYFLELTDLFKPAKVGFQCHDRALSMPYVETNEELIPLLMLLSLAFAAPAASVRPGLFRCGGRGRAGDWGPSAWQCPASVGWLCQHPRPAQSHLSQRFLPRSWSGRAWCTACSPG